MKINQLIADNWCCPNFFVDRDGAGGYLDRVWLYVPHRWTGFGTGVAVVIWLNNYKFTWMERFTKEGEDAQAVLCLEHKRDRNDNPSYLFFSNYRLQGKITHREWGSWWHGEDFYSPKIEPENENQSINS